MQRGAPIVGQTGIKYGLQKPGGAPGGPPKKLAAPVRPANVFGDDSDDDEDVATQVARQAEKKRAAAKVGSRTVLVLQ